MTRYLRVDFQMQLAHARDYGFFALWVIMNSERWILPGEAVDTFGEFVQVILSEYKIVKSNRCYLDSRVRFLLVHTVQGDTEDVLPCWLASLTWK